MSSISRIALVGYSAVVTALALLMWGKHAYLSFEIAQARQQIDYFYDLSDEARLGNRSSAIAHLEAVLYFYPSGTRFTSGSVLDSLVENDRSRASQRIIDHLRKISGEDCGNDPQEWIRSNR